MRKIKNYIVPTVSFLLCCTISTACSQSTDTLSVIESSTAQIISQSAELLSSQAAKSGTETFTGTNATIILADDNITIDGNGATANKSVLTISSAGSYLISGELANGQIIVDAGENADVTLYLNGVSVTSFSSALYIKSGENTAIYLAEGSENIFCDSQSYPADETDADACIFSKSDLNILGKGKITVTGNYNHGIHSKDSLDIKNGEIYVTAANDGIKGKDSVQITDGIISITSEGDGISSDNTEDADKGFVSIQGGDINVITGGGSANAAHHQDSFFNSTDDNSVSAKGIKAQTSIEISGGTLTLDCCDDAIHSNADINISDGTLTISSGDDGIHADNALNISGGSGTISKSYEGLEGATINISDGSWSVTASDDGINAAGGSDDTQSQTDGRRQDIFASNDNNNVEISGGYLYVNADGDGIDSNGALTISGGEVYVDGPTNDGNGSLDFGGICTVTNATLVAAGSSGMAQTPSEQSTQNTIAVFFTSQQTAGQSVTIKNSNGDELITYTPSKTYQSIIFSSPKLTADSTVTVFANDTELCTAVLSQSVTKINENGEAVNGGQFGGMGGFGGGRGEFGGGRGDFNTQNNPTTPSEISTEEAANTESVSADTPNSAETQPNIESQPDSENMTPPDLPNGEQFNNPPDSENKTPPDLPNGEQFNNRPDFGNMTPPDFDNQTPPQEADANDGTTV